MKRKQIDNVFSKLLSDELFIRWIINPSKESDSYWQKKIESEPQLSKDIHILKNILKNLKVREPELTPNQRKEIWNKIEEATLKKNPSNRFIRRTWIKVASVAAIFVLITVNLWFFMSENEKQEGLDYVSIIKDTSDFDLTTGDVTLVLSEDKQVNVHTDSTEVVYDTKGRIKVNSEEIHADETITANVNQLIVPYGKTTFLTLSDGTKVWINSGSKLIYPSVFNDKKREVYITGEAYFDVAKKEKQPFIINTNELDITVKGTQLNITAYNDEYQERIVLVSGKVEVNSKKDKATSYNMSPNQLLSYDLSSKETDVKEVDVTMYVSWINGYLLLQSESLDRLLGRIDRHYNTTTRYNKNDIRKIKVSGKLDMKKEIDKILEYISTTAPITYQVNGKEVSVKIRKPPQYH